MQPGHYQTRNAAVEEAQWVVDLSVRVQIALKAAGSLQELTFMGQLSTLEASIRAQEIFVFLEATTQTRLGSMTICPFAPEAEHGSWEWNVEGPGKKWFLHSFMLDPESQGQGIGLEFLRGAVELLAAREGEGVIVLDCWAGNDKLRAFYERAGCVLVGVFPQSDYEIAVFELRFGANK